MSQTCLRFSDILKRKKDALEHNENKAFKALFCVIPAITSKLVFNFFNWFIFTWYCNYLFNWLCNILFMAKYTYLPTYLLFPHILMKFQIAFLIAHLVFTIILWYIIERYNWKLNERAIPSLKKKKQTLLAKEWSLSSSLWGRGSPSMSTAWLNDRSMDAAQK